MPPGKLAPTPPTASRGWVAAGIVGDMENNQFLHSDDVLL